MHFSIAVNRRNHCRKSRRWFLNFDYSILLSRLLIFEHCSRFISLPNHQVRSFGGHLEGHLRDTLSNILGNTLSAILGIILSVTLCRSLKCHHNKATIDSPCWCSNTSLLASLHDAFYTRPLVLNIGCIIQHKNKHFFFRS